MFRCLHTPPRSARHLSREFYNLTPDTPVDVGDILFKKLEDEESAGSPTTPVPAAGKATGGGKAGKAAGGKAAAPASEYAHAISFTKLDIRVGKIVKVWEHETSSRLFCEEVDVGDGGENPLRTVASGIRGVYTKEQLLGRKVVVVCNLKEMKLQGFLSRAMVLAAKDGESIAK